MKKTNLITIALFGVLFFLGGCAVGGGGGSSSLSPSYRPVFDTAGGIDDNKLLTDKIQCTALAREAVSSRRGIDPATGMLFGAGGGAAAGAIGGSMAGNTGGGALIGTLIGGVLAAMWQLLKTQTEGQIWQSSTQLTPTVSVVVGGIQSTLRETASNLKSWESLLGSSSLFFYYTMSYSLIFILLTVYVLCLPYLKIHTARKKKTPSLALGVSFVTRNSVLTSTSTMWRCQQECRTHYLQRSISYCL